jgi:hypothetical protein
VSWSRTCSSASTTPSPPLAPPVSASMKSTSRAPTSATKCETAGRTHGLDVTLTVSESSGQFGLPPQRLSPRLTKPSQGWKTRLRPNRTASASSTSRSSECCRQRTVKRCLNCVPGKIGRPAWQEGRDMILQIQRGLREDGFMVPMAKLCRWFDVPRRTVYYKPIKAKPKVQAPIYDADQTDGRG